MKNILRIVPVCLALGLSAAPAMASEPVKLGDFGRWSAYAFEENGGKVCYMAAKPATAVTEPKGRARGDIVALITHRPAEGTKNVFSYMSGYGYKKGSDVQLSIDNQKFSLFTQNDMAWAADGSADTAIANAIRKGDKMVVKGESSKGTKTTDTFSLSGSTKAHEAINKECGL